MVCDEILCGSNVYSIFVGLCDRMFPTPFTKTAIVYTAKLVTCF